MNIIKIVLTILGIAVFGVVSLLAVNSFKRYTDVVAVNECASTYNQTFKKGDITITRPLEQAVKECVWQKGVRNWTGVWTDLPK